MIRKSKLEVFKVNLRSAVENAGNTFRDLLKNKYPPENQENFKVEDAYKSLLQTLVSTIDDDFYLNQSKRKALGIKKNEEDESTITSIKINSAKHIIHGVIDGGKYGQNRDLGNINNPKKKRRKIQINEIVLDKFYFLLYTPFGSNKGILMLQSYNDDQINDIFKPWLWKSLKTKGFYNCEISTYCPQSIKDQFIENSYIKELKFKDDIIISDIEESNSIQTKEYSIEIIIKAKTNGEQVSNLNRFKNFFSNYKIFNGKKNIPLEHFNKKIGVLNDGDYQSSFVLDNDMDIKPTIYLTKKINFQPDDTPDWNSLHKYCLKILEEVKKEVYPEDNAIS